MGALLTHYFANVQTVVSYSVTTTSLGAAATTKSVLPDLRLLMGTTELPVVYTHTVELTHSGGPELDRAEIGLSISGPARVLGNIVPSPPDPVHPMTCKDFDQKSQSVVCSVGRISSNVNPYRFVMATDQKADIILSIDAKNTRVERSDSREAKQSTLFGGPNSILFGIIAVMAMSAVQVIIERLAAARVRRKQRPSE